jgi:predicted nucleic acid-binding protein
LYLVDTSVWIDYLRQEDTEGVRFFEEILDLGYPFGITPEIYQEVLQGAASEESFERLAEYLGTQRFFRLKDGVESHREAARLYFRCRRSGVTVRSTIDCIIARISIEHGLLLLHNDKDFMNMAGIVPGLRLA